MKKLPVFFTAVAAIAVTGMVYSWLADDSTYRRASIVTASVAYLLVAATAGAFKSKYGVLVFVALIFCFLGDLFGPGNFLFGVVMFLIAHLAFIPAFLVRGVSIKGLVASVLVAIGFTAGITLYLAGQIPPNERPFIYAYSVVLALMLGFAGGTLGAGSKGLVPLAALLFYVSDFFLAQTAFLDGGRIWTITGYPMYYSACILFAWTILEPSPMRMKPLTT